MADDEGPAPSEDFNFSEYGDDGDDDFAETSVLRHEEAEDSMYRGPEDSMMSDRGGPPIGGYDGYDDDDEQFQMDRMDTGFSEGGFTGFGTQTSLLDGVDGGPATPTLMAKPSTATTAAAEELAFSAVAGDMMASPSRHRSDTEKRKAEEERIAEEELERWETQKSLISGSVAKTHTRNLMLSDSLMDTPVPVGSERTFDRMSSGVGTPHSMITPDSQSRPFDSDMEYGPFTPQSERLPAFEGRMFDTPTTDSMQDYASSVGTPHDHDASGLITPQSETGRTPKGQFPTLFSPASMGSTAVSELVLRREDSVQSMGSVDSGLGSAGMGSSLRHERTASGYPLLPPLDDDGSPEALAGAKARGSDEMTEEVMREAAIDETAGDGGKLAFLHAFRNSVDKLDDVGMDSPPPQIRERTGSNLTEDNLETFDRTGDRHKHGGLGDGDSDAATGGYLGVRPQIGVKLSTEVELDDGDADADDALGGYEDLGMDSSEELAASDSDLSGEDEMAFRQRRPKVMDSQRTVIKAVSSSISLSLGGMDDDGHGHETQGGGDAADKLRKALHSGNGNSAETERLEEELIEVRNQLQAIQIKWQESQTTLRRFQAGAAEREMHWEEDFNARTVELQSEMDKSQEFEDYYTAEFNAHKATKRELGEAVESNEGLRQGMDEMTEQLQNANDDILSHQRRIEDLTRQHSKLATSRALERRDYRSSLDEMSSTIGRLDAEKGLLIAGGRSSALKDTDTTQLQAEVVRLEEELAAAQKTIGQVMDDSESALEELSAAKILCDELEAENTTLREENKKVVEANVTQEQVYDQLTVDYMQVVDMIDEMNAVLLSTQKPRGMDDHKFSDLKSRSILVAQSQRARLNTMEADGTLSAFTPSASSRKGGSITGFGDLATGLFSIGMGDVPMEESEEEEEHDFASSVHSSLAASGPLDISALASGRVPGWVDSLLDYNLDLSARYRLGGGSRPHDALQDFFYLEAICIKLKLSNKYALSPECGAKGSELWRKAMACNIAMHEFYDFILSELEPVFFGLSKDSRCRLHAVVVTDSGVIAKLRAERKRAAALERKRKMAAKMPMTAASMVDSATDFFLSMADRSVVVPKGGAAEWARSGGIYGDQLAAGIGDGSMRTRIVSREERRKSVDARKREQREERKRKKKRKSRGSHRRAESKASKGKKDRSSKARRKEGSSGRRTESERKEEASASGGYVQTARRRSRELELGTRPSHDEMDDSYSQKPRMVREGTIVATR